MSDEAQEIGRLRKLVARACSCKTGFRCFTADGGPFHERDPMCPVHGDEPGNWWREKVRFKDIVRDLASGCPGRKGLCDFCVDIEADAPAEEHEKTCLYRRAVEAMKL